MRYHWTFLFLLIIILTASMLRGIALNQKQLLTHDEGISYLVATCHQQSYERAVNGPLVGKWAPASAWKEFLRPDRIFCFQ
jgi:hypothetical protein